MSERSSRPPELALVGLLAVAAGATVVNIYYSQPILGKIAHSFSVSTSAASLIFTLVHWGSCPTPVLMPGSARDDKSRPARS